MIHRKPANPGGPVNAPLDPELLAKWKREAASASHRRKASELERRAIRERRRKP